jgi:hemoglobin/transferrin/lactoferrin receptor protein
MSRYWRRALPALLAMQTAALAADPPPFPVLDEEAAPDTIAVAPLRPAGDADPRSTGPAARLDTITTTATRTARRAFATPESLSRLSAADIEQRGASTLAEALEGVMSVDITGGPRPGAGFISIRGVGGTRVALNVDGARQNFDGAHRSNLMLDPDLLKSIDILRGPASAIWGSDALGGVISMTTRDAADFLDDDQTLGGRLKFGLESANGERRHGATAFGRFGGLDLLADTTWRDSHDITQADDAVLPHSAAESRGGLYKLTQFFSAANELTLSQQDYVLDTRSPSNPTKDVADDNPLLDRTNRQRITTLRYSYQAQRPDPRVAGGNVTLYRSAADIVEDRVDEPRHDTLDFRTLGGSVQSTFNLPALASRLTAGAEAYQDESSAQRNGAARPQFPDAVRDVRGAFIQNEVQWGGLSIIPGLRYDHFESRSRQSETPDVTESAVSPKLGLNYALTDWLSFNAAWAGAFRAPSLLESFAQGTHFLGNEFRPNPDLRPEKARNRELGLRLQWADLLGAPDTLEIRLSAFDNEVRDYIETVVVVEQEGPFPPALQCAPPAPAVGCVNRTEDGGADPSVPVLIWIGGYTTSANLPRARIRGAEAELEYSLGGYRFGLSYAGLRGENTASGMPLLSIPPDTLRLDLGYRWQRLHIGVRATQASTQDRVPLLEDGSAVTSATPGYAVADLYGQWLPFGSHSALKLNFGVDNLTDRAFRHHLSSYDEPGRSLRAGLTYQF